MSQYLHIVGRHAWLALLFLLFFHAISTEAQSIQQWYDDAQERIDTLRKGRFEIQVFDQNGQPYTGLLKVRMKKHEYPFGIAFDFYEGEVETEVPTQTQWMKAAMYKYFNYGVSGNSFKWSGIDPNGNGPNHTNFEHALAWTQKVGWELRAHTLLWGGSEGDNHAMPQWVTNLGSAEAVFAKCDERVRREVSRYKGLVKEYDVINEPIHATYTQDLYGDSLNWKAFQWAREEDPDAELFINEYNVEFAWGDLDEYKALIEEVISKGAPVTGIGIQAHFWDCCRPSVNEVVTSINSLAEFGLPIKLTEFDFGGNLTEAEQAADLIKVYTIAFSHPSVNGIVYWNLADHLSWRENAGLLKEDRTPKLAADTLLYLTRELWATNFEETPDANGALAFNAYYGDYVVEVQFGETIKQFSLPLYRENEGEVYVLNEAEAEMKSLELISAEINELDELTLTFDQPIDPGTIDKYDFRVFAPNDATVASIATDASDASVLVLSLDKEVSVLDYVTVSYFPGTLTAVNGAVAEAFGVEEARIRKDLNEAPTVENYYEFEVQPNASGGTQLGAIEADDPEGVEVTYRIGSGDHLGVFGIGRTNGILSLLNPFYLDFEANPTYELVIEVSDGVHVVNVDVRIAPGTVLGLNTPQVLIYPNPSNGQIHLSNVQRLSHVSLHDMSGRAVYLQRFGSDPKENFSISVDVKPGLYLLKMYGEVLVETQKVVIK